MKKDEIKKVSDGLAEVVAQVAFMVWQKEDFRELINFDKISQTEQDRIFNELEVSFLGLFVLYLDQLSSELETSEKEVVIQLKGILPESFVELFDKLGVEKKFVDIWRKLIDLRFEEYYRDWEMITKEGLPDEHEFRDNDSFKRKMARLQTITLDCLTHIRRGKLEQKDPLMKYLRQWVIGTDHIFAESVKKMVFQPIGYS